MGKIASRDSQPTCVAKEELEYRAKMRDRIILWTVLPIVLIAGAAAIFYFITFLKSLK